jgi:hypothetical protein
MMRTNSEISNKNLLELQNALDMRVPQHHRIESHRTIQTNRASPDNSMEVSIPTVHPGNETTLQTDRLMEQYGSLQKSPSGLESRRNSIGGPSSRNSYRNYEHTADRRDLTDEKREIMLSGSKAIMHAIHGERPKSEVRVRP